MYSEDNCDENCPPGVPLEDLRQKLISIRTGKAQTTINTDRDITPRPEPSFSSSHKSERAIDVMDCKLSTSGVSRSKNPRRTTLSQMDKGDLLRERWATPALANPKANLTVLAYSTDEGHRLPLPVSLEVDLVEGCKLLDLNEAPPTKRRRCSLVLDGVIGRLTQQMAILKTVLAGKAYQYSRRSQPMKLERRTRAYSERYNQRHQQPINDKERKLLKAMEQLTKKIQHLKQARDEMLTFHRFYDDREGSVSLLDEDEVAQLMDNEKAIGSYSMYYG